MDSARTLSEIQQYVQYAAAKKMLRHDAYGSLFFGVVGVAVGMSGLRDTFLNLILVGLGVLLLISGTVSIVRPGLAALALSAGSMLLLAVWNAFVFFTELPYSKDPRVQLLILALIQFAWGVKMLMRGSRKAAGAMKQPPSQVAEQIDDLLKKAADARESQGEDCVEFTSDSFWGRHQYHGRLADGMTILADESQTRVFCTTPRETVLTLKMGGLKLKGNKGKLRLGEKTLGVVISQVSAERFRKWSDKAIKVSSSSLATVGQGNGPEDATEREQGAAAGVAEREGSSVGALRQYLEPVTEVFRLRSSIQHKCSLFMAVTATLLSLMCLGLLMPSSTGERPLHNVRVILALLALSTVVISALAATIRPTVRMAMVPAIGFLALCGLILAAAAVQGRIGGGLLLVGALAAIDVQFIRTIRDLGRKCEEFMGRSETPVRFAEATTLLTSIARAKPKNQANAVELKEQGKIVGGHWKGVLLDDTAVFALTNGSTAIPIGRGQITLEGFKRRLLRRSRKGTIRIATTVLEVKMREESRRRIEEWNAGASVGAKAELATTG